VRHRVRVGATLIAFSLLAASPASAQSDDPALASALAAREAGRTQEAVERFEALARGRPNDPTILRLLGNSYAAAAKYGQAAATLATAQCLAPGDRDIALARARVALWMGRPKLATAIADAVSAAEPTNPELPALRTSIAAAKVHTGQVGLTIAQGVSRVTLRAGKRTWTETVVAGNFDIARATILTGEVEHFDRGRQSDTRGGLRVDTRLTPGLRAYFGASATPSADFRERWAIRGGGEASIDARFTATLEVSYAKYEQAGIIAIAPGMRWITHDARIAVALRSINLIDNTGKLRTGAGGQIDWAMSAGMRLLAGGARYSDAEAGVVRRVDSVFAGAHMTLTKALTVRLTIDHDRRVTTYRRTGISVGLRWQPGL
jgi:YaiO family outer membrane protein